MIKQREVQTVIHYADGRTVKKFLTESTIRHLKLAMIGLGRFTVLADKIDRIEYDVQ